MSEDLKALFLQMGEKPIAYQPVYAKIGGWCAEGLLLSQIVYWWKSKKWEEFYKSDKEFCEELVIGKKEFRNSKERLVELGLITATVKGFPAKTFYSPDIEKIVASIISYPEREKLASVYPKRQNKFAPNGKTAPIYTENTTENKDKEKAEDLFSLFWTIYPRKEDKKNSERKFAALSDKDKLAAYEWIKRFSSYWKDSGTAIQYIPHPSTFLNGRRWEDEIPEIVRQRSFEKPVPKNVLTGTRNYSAGIENFQALAD